MRLYIRDGKTVCRSWGITKVIKQNKKTIKHFKKKKKKETGTKPIK